MKLKSLNKMVAVLFFFTTVAAYAQTETYYYFTQSTGKRKGEIVLGYVKEANCDWGGYSRSIVYKWLDYDYYKWVRRFSWSKDYTNDIHIYTSRDAAERGRNSVARLSDVHNDDGRYYDPYEFDCDETEYYIEDQKDGLFDD